MGMWPTSKDEFVEELESYKTDLEEEITSLAKKIEKLKAKAE
jgi:chaperonin cofactor prefoldin